MEQRYSQTKREALAVAWGCNHFHLYLLGTHFTVLTDQKPLVSINNKTGSSPPVKITTWIFQINSRTMTTPSSITQERTILQTDHVGSSSTECYVNFVATHAVPKALTLDELKEATKADSTLQAAAQLIRTQAWQPMMTSSLRS